VRKLTSTTLLRIASACLLFAITQTSIAAPIVVQKGSISGYVYIPGTSIAASSGSSASSGNCYYSPTTDSTITFSSLPAALFPLTVDYKMVGGGGGGSEALAWGGGGGGGSSAILNDGVVVAVANGGKGADQGTVAGVNGSVATGSFQILQASSVRFVVGGGGGSSVANSGLYYYENYSDNSRQYFYSGAGGGAGYFGGGGGGSGQGGAASYQGKGGAGGGSSLTSGSAGGAAGAWNATSTCRTNALWYCTIGPGANGALGLGGNGGNISYGGGYGGSQFKGGTSSGSGYYVYPTSSGYQPAGPGGGFGSGGGVGNYIAPTNASLPNYTIRAGSTGLPAINSGTYASFGSITFTNGGISSLSIHSLAGAAGDLSKSIAASGGQIVIRYSSPSCNVF